MWFTEARLAYGPTPLLALVIGVATGAWVAASAADRAQHAMIAVSGLEIALPAALVVVGVRAFTHDVNVGMVESLAVRGAGYPLRLLVRMLWLQVLPLVAILVPAIVIDRTLGTGVTAIALALVPGAALLGTLAAALSAWARSELVGALLGAGWWLVNVLAMHTLPVRFPGSLMNLFTYQVGDLSWPATKAAQLCAAIAVAAVLSASGPRLVRLVITRPVA